MALKRPGVDCDMNLKHLSGFKSFLSVAIFTLGLAACGTTPEAEPVEPIVEVEVVPSIDIEEYERQLAEADAAARALDEEAIRRAEAEAAIVEAELAAQAKAEADAAAAKQRAEAEARKTPLERAAETENPDEKIQFLSEAENTPDVLAARVAAYRSKLVADEASGNLSGQAEALVFLADLDAAKSTRSEKISALKGYAQAQSLDPDNADAPSKLSALRASLQPDADRLHEQAVSFFVNQDFLPAIERWTTVLLIDPGNSAARNWFEQAKEAVGR